MVLTYKGQHAGVLLRRYKRFLGDVVLLAGGQQLGDADALAAACAAAAEASSGDDGAAISLVVHVPNTGPMRNLLTHLPSPALLSRSDNPKRKWVTLGRGGRGAGGATRVWLPC